MIAFQRLRQPFLINDPEMQVLLQDRREVHRILKENNIETPTYLICDRTDPNLSFLESDNSVIINGKEIEKPFVEKPISAEDHNVYIYYHSSTGGGHQKLFRKVKNLSSCYYPENNVRSTGSYIYEKFVRTDGTDVKAYAVGSYVHAEARKCPGLDGQDRCSKCWLTRVKKTGRD